MTKAKRDLLNSIIILLFCGIALYGTSLIPERGLNKFEADFFPKIIIGILAILGILLLAQSLLKFKKQSKDDTKFTFKKLFAENKKVILTFVIFGLYILSLEILGYFISSILFLFGLYLVLANNRKNLIYALIGSIIFTALLYFIFQNALSVFLPKGILF